MATSVPATSVPTTASTDELPWWLGIVQGIALVVLGVLCLTAPGATLVVLVQLAGIYWLVTGILDLVGLFGDRRHSGWKLFAGIIGVAAGIAVIAHPMWAAVLVPTTLVLVIGIFGIVNGVLVMVRSFAVRMWTGVALGLVSIVLGGVLVMNPLIGAASLPFVIGIVALVGGILSVGIAFAERGRRRRAAAAAVAATTSPSMAPAAAPPAPAAPVVPAAPAAPPAAVAAATPIDEPPEDSGPSAAASAVAPEGADVADAGEAEHADDAGATPGS